MEVSLHTGKTF